MKQNLIENKIAMYFLNLFELENIDFLHESFSFIKDYPFIKEQDKEIMMQNFYRLLCNFADFSVKNYETINNCKNQITDNKDSYKSILQEMNKINQEMIKIRENKIKN